MRSMSKRGALLARLLCLLSLSALLLSGLPVYEASAQTETLWLETRFDSPGSSIPRTWRFPYLDDLFAADADMYNHTLAQSSLGLALSAFRIHGLGPDQQDVNVRAYLEGAGFTALVSQGYAQIPTKDTISTMIGSKKIDGFTLVAVAVCGWGYGDEWLGNFTVGDAERHAGFDGAAQKVQTRVRDYLAEQGVTGIVKLWMTGYSRAAAVTNLAAADLTDSGAFADVFAYTFATPRVTKSPKDDPNIYNIIGKFDPVPMVPLPEWGYARNGVDLYTPAMETDTDYVLKKAAADAVSRKLTGIAFFNNAEMNDTLRTMYYFGAEYRVDAVRAAVDKTTITEMKQGEYYVIASLRDQDAADGAHLVGSKTEEYAVWDDMLPYSPSLINALQNSNVFHLTFGQMALIAGAALVLLLALLVWLIVHIARRRRRAKRAKIDAAMENGTRG